MGPTVCLAANTIYYPAGFWPYLNWALSLRSAGCALIWLEGLESEEPPAELDRAVAVLRRQLEPYGLEDILVLADRGGREVNPLPTGTSRLETAHDADLLIDLAYMPSSLVRRFRRSAFVDLDPGVTQIWASRGELDIGNHDAYFSIGEAVEAGGARFPDCGVRWRYTPPPVALDEWSPASPSAGAAYTTVSHWWDSTTVEVDGEWVENSKRAGFEPFLDLPARSRAPLELALGGLDDDDELRGLERRGWRIRDASEVASTPEGYRQYVRASRGEFSAAKPPYVLLQTGWLNDRTASYLAAGKPAVLQRTGRSLIPDDEGLLRFETLGQAARALDAVEADYDHHSKRARELAEARFDGRKVVGRLLEHALD